MLKLKKIAITGGVASGKTSVCQFFQELGAYTVNADAIVHELLKSDTDLVQQIILQIGPDIIESGENGKNRINRRIVAEKVFKDPKRLQKLEELLHPAVLHRIEELYDRASKAGRYSFFVVEIPLLFEIGNEKCYDVIVAVLADEAIAKTRFEQAGFQSTEYDRRMSRQINPRAKATKADFTIHNNGSLENLRNEVIKLNAILQKNS